MKCNLDKKISLVKNIFLAYILLIVVIFSVHCSIYTVDVPNPLTLIGMLFAMEDISDCCFFVAGYMIQCCITFLIAAFVFKWFRFRLWFFSCAIGVLLLIFYWFLLNSICSEAIILLASSWAYSYYEFYGYIEAFQYALVFIVFQILFVLMYVVLSWIDNRINHANILVNEDLYILEKLAVFIFPFPMLIPMGIVMMKTESRLRGEALCKYTLFGMMFHCILFMIFI